MRARARVRTAELILLLFFMRFIYPVYSGGFYFWPLPRPFCLLALFPHRGTAVPVKARCTRSFTAFGNRRLSCRRSTAVRRRVESDFVKPRGYLIKIIWKRDSPSHPKVRGMKLGNPPAGEFSVLLNCYSRRACRAHFPSLSRARARASDVSPERRIFPK